MAETPRFYDADNPEWRDYEQPYAQGGYIPGGPVSMLRHHDDYFFTAEQVKRLGTAMLDKLNVVRDTDGRDDAQR